MKKTKLFGSKLISGVNVPKIPNVIILEEQDSIKNITIDKGDLFDADTVKKAILSIPTSGQPAIITEQEIDELF